MFVYFLIVTQLKINHIQEFSPKRNDSFASGWIDSNMYISYKNCIFMTSQVLSFILI